MANLTIGSDEAGYGAWAGPLVVCAVVMPQDWPGVPKLKDSKVMSKKAREEVFRSFSFAAVNHVVIVPPEKIDQDGVWTCLCRAHAEAIQHLAKLVAGNTVNIIVDGNVPVVGATSVPKADALFPVVSLASVLAKVTRDRIMALLDKDYPGYGFSKHVGYGVPFHQEALKRLGPCPIHRRSYEPVRRAVEERENREREFPLGPED